jgi:sporulation protein YlmC with PRC-barrel domain
VLATCHGFLVDDDRGHEVGVVEDVALDPISKQPTQLLVAQRPGRHVTLTIDDVIEVAPSERRLVTASGAGHLTPLVDEQGTPMRRLGGVVRTAKSLVARLTGHRP